LQLNWFTLKIRLLRQAIAATLQRHPQAGVDSFSMISNRIPLTFEQLNIGDRWQSDSRTIEQKDIQGFADLTGDHDRLHTDHEFATSSPFGQPIAHGMLGMSILIGLSSTAPTVRTAAFVDVRNWTFHKPVFPGDTVHVVTEVIDLKPHGRRHGQVHWYRQLFNQRGEKVQDGILVTLVSREHPVSPKPRRADGAHASPPAPPRLEEALLPSDPAT
jgi:acyl dehydratase